MNELKKIIDLNSNMPYNTNPEGGEGEKGKMRKEEMLTREEKRNIVNGVDEAVKATGKPIYKVCEELKVHPYAYYNWSKSLMRFDAKEKTKADRKAKREANKAKKMAKHKGLSIPKITIEKKVKKPAINPLPQAFTRSPISQSVGSKEDAEFFRQRIDSKIKKLEYLKEALTELF